MVAPPPPPPVDTVAGGLVTMAVPLPPPPDGTIVGVNVFGVAIVVGVLFTALCALALALMCALVPGPARP